MRPTSPYLNWSALAEYASSARRRAVVTADDGFRLEAAEAIARRHAGNSAMPLRELPASTGRVLQLRFLAQRVQQANDTGSANLESLIAEARRELPGPAESLQEELRVHGAVGRALGILRRHDEARALLERVVSCWRTALQPDEASHPVSAWIHLLAFSGTNEEAERAEAVARELMAEGVSALFPALSLGRMWFRRDGRVGHMPERARSWFERVRSFVLPPGPRAVVARFESLAQGRAVEVEALSRKRALVALVRLELGNASQEKYLEEMQEFPEAAHLIRSAGRTPLDDVLRLEYPY